MLQLAVNSLFLLYFYTTSVFSDSGMHFGNTIFKPLYGAIADQNVGCVEL